jgi:hypothetical protein
VQLRVCVCLVPWCDFIASITCRLFKWSIPCYTGTLIHENLIDLNYYSLCVNIVFSDSTPIEQQGQALTLRVQAYHYNFWIDTEKALNPIS